jgi:hypothetical protein
MIRVALARGHPNDAISVFQRVHGSWRAEDAGTNANTEEYVMAAKISKSKNPVPEQISPVPAKSEPQQTVNTARRTKRQPADAAIAPEVMPADLVAKPTSGTPVELEGDKNEVKPKWVRDSFKFPQQEYIAFHALKARCLNSGRVVKKSELVRAGLIALLNLTDEQLLEVMSGLEKPKAGRSAK